MGHDQRTGELMQAVLTENGPVREIAGWFDYGEFWDRAVETAHVGATIVEIGVFCGKSLMYLGQKAKESGKNLRVVGIDNFQGSPEFQDRVFFNDVTWPNFPHGTMVRECLNNLQEAGLSNDVTVIVSDSASAARFFAPRSVHAVFLDGDHSEQGFGDDMRAWLPQVAPGGLFGGHDVWTFPDVEKVVRAMLPDVVLDAGRTWWERQC